MLHPGPGTSEEAVGDDVPETSGALDDKDRDTQITEPVKPDVPAPKTKPSKPRKKRLLWLGILALLAVIASVLWALRYPIIENYALNKLAAQGIDANLSLDHISKNRAVIKDIHLASEGRGFFSAREVELDYNWREALTLHFQRVQIDNPAIEIDIDGQGKITSSWMPEGGAPNTSSAVFPDRGIDIKDGQVTLKSPFGDFVARIDAQSRSETDMTAQIEADPQALSYQGFQGDVGGHLDLTLDGNNISYAASFLAPAFTYEQFSGTGLSAVWSANTDRTRIFKDITSKTELRFDRLASKDVAAANGVIVWDGTIKRPSSQEDGLAVIGAWSADVTQTGVTNPDRRQRLAESVTLNETLLNISASAPFAPGLTDAVEGLLRENRFTASGQLQIDREGASIDLDGPAHIYGQQNELQLNPVKDGPFLAFDRDGKNLTVIFDGVMDGPYAASLSGAKLVAKIEDGRHFSNIKSFKAKLETLRTWRALTKPGRPVRLSPMRVDVDYDASQTVRRVRLAGAINYDGEVPGGYAKGLRANGVLNLRLGDEALSAQFTPYRHTTVKIARLETTSDWVITGADFALSAATPQYRRGKTRGNITAKIMNGQGRLTHRTEPQDLAFELGEADVTGVINNTRQDWSVKARDTHITSENFPSPQTDIKAGQARLTATLEPGAPVSFTVESPAADIKTQLVSAVNMSVSVAGTPGDLTVDYGHKNTQGEARVKFSAGALPVLPLSGRVAFKDTAWTGTAVTTLPKSDQTPINISYKFENGAGAANVIINDLPFSPSKLQPQQLVSALSGKVSRVEGLVSARIDLSFGVDQPLKSSGTAIIKNLNAATLPGPFSGLNGELMFSSFFPLQTDGLQTMTLDRFDPGFPLENGKMDFEIIPGGVKIESAQWPLGTGEISLDPTTWLYAAPQNRVKLRIDNVSIGEFLDNVGGGKLRATGDMSGLMPVLIEGVKVHVEGGSLIVKDGGVIEYTSPEAEAAGQSNEYAGYAFEALKHFEYDELEATLNGPLDGPMKLRMKFGGSNPDVLYGSEFKFNVGIEGELLNIMRSLKMGDSISAKILEDIQSRQDQTLQKP